MVLKEKRLEKMMKWNPSSGSEKRLYGQCCIYLEDIVTEGRKPTMIWKTILQ